MEIEKQKKIETKRSTSRTRRGVGAIVGGALIALILFTSVFIYFMVITQSESAKGKGEVQAARIDESKRLETFIARTSNELVPDPNDASKSFIPVLVNDTGPLTLNATHALVTVADGSDPEINPLQLMSASGNANDQVLNPGQSAVFFVRSPDNIPASSKTYHIDIISSRGNVVGTQWPPIDGSGGPGGSGGEANVCNNLGTDPGSRGLYVGKTGVTLDFLSLKAGNGIAIEPDGSGNLVVTNTKPEDGSGGGGGGAVTGAVNEGGKARVFDNAASTPQTLTFRTIEGTGGITATESGTGTIKIDGSQLALEQPQRTGSLQLDFKSFGVIFEKYASRNGVDQTGWLVKSANATGYPAYMLPIGPKMYVVDRVRNLDAQGYAIELGRSTSLQLSLGNCNGANTCPPIFLCNSDLTSANVNTSPLTDPPGISIPATSPAAGDDVGWKELVFCSATQGADGSDGSQWWVRANMQNPVNSLFMVARGVYGGTSFSFAQTIPYQATYLAHQGGSNFANSAPDNSNMVACLLASDANTKCTDPLGNTQPAGAKYLGSSGQSLFIHVNPITCSGTCSDRYNAVWVYPISGKVQNLATNVQLDGNRNIPVTIPAVAGGYYTIMLSTGYSSSSNQDVYYLTFQVIGNSP